MFFVPQTGVLQGAYGGPFIEVPASRHHAISRYFDAHLDAQRGDAIVQIVRYTPATWLRLGAYFTRHGVGRLMSRKRSAPGRGAP